MVWVCVSSQGTNGIQIIEGEMNRVIYWKILGENLLLSSRMMRTRRGWSFQEDNGPENKGVGTAQLPKIPTKLCERFQC